MSEAHEPFDQWALVEVMGHQRFAGRVTEQTIAGAAFIRVDVPEFGDRPAFTKLLGAGSIFAITPLTEEACRNMAGHFRARAVEQCYLVPALPGPAALKGGEKPGWIESYDDRDEDGDLY